MPSRVDRRPLRHRAMIRATVVAVLVVLTLVLVGCASGSASTPPTPVASPVVTPTPTVLDSGPTDAVSAAFAAAQAGDMSAQVDFLACIVGGTDATTFSTLFSGLAELALVLSGVDPEAYWTAVGLTLDDFSATETSRTDSQATVRVEMTVSFEPDVAALRELMRRNLPADDPEVDVEVIDAIIEGLIDRDRLPRAVDQEVTVTRSAGTWTVCGS
jgi:hypothetical protein